MNRLFVAYKPPFISSNAFLGQLKRKYGVKKGGFSGTLDPFACGVLIIAFGAYTKLFRFLKKSPKVYRASLWLGAKSASLDLENIEDIQDVLPVDEKKIREAVESFEGPFTYSPPKYSAKRIDGRRAYKLAASGESVHLPKITSTIYAISMLGYNHPFVTFEATVSEGTYIRSIAQALAEKLHLPGTLSYLERIKEGAFVYEDEKALNPLDYLWTSPNTTSLSEEEVWHGKKLTLDDLAIKEDGIYHLVFENFFAIIEVKNQKVCYLLNHIPLKKES